MQNSDLLLEEVLVFWRRQVQPTVEERRKLSKPALALLQQWDRLVEKDGVLYR